MAGRDERAGSGDAVTGSAGNPAGDERTRRIAELASAIATIGPDGAAGTPRRGDRRARDSQVRHDRRRIEESEPAQRPPGVRDVRRSGPPAPEENTDDPGDPESVARSICLRLLTAAARSRADLAEALRRREIPDDVATAVLDRFVEVGLIDDAAYAAAYVANKQRDRGLGSAALRTELRRKGITGAVAEAALSTVDPTSEHDRATDLVAKRLDSAMFAGPIAARRRLLGLLARRGYPAGLAASVVDDALRGYGESTEVDPADESLAAGWGDAPS